MQWPGKQSRTLADHPMSTHAPQSQRKQELTGRAKTMQCTGKQSRTVKLHVVLTLRTLAWTASNFRPVKDCTMPGTAFLMPSMPEWTWNQGCQHRR